MKKKTARRSADRVTARKRNEVFGVCLAGGIGTGAGGVLLLNFQGEHSILHWKAVDLVSFLMATAVVATISLVFLHPFFERILERYGEHVREGHSARITGSVLAVFIIGAMFEHALHLQLAEGSDGWVYLIWGSIFGAMLTGGWIWGARRRTPRIAYSGLVAGFGGVFLVSLPALLFDRTFHFLSDALPLAALFGTIGLCGGYAIQRPWRLPAGVKVMIGVLAPLLIMDALLMLLQGLPGIGPLQEFRRPWFHLALAIGWGTGLWMHPPSETTFSAWPAEANSL